MKGLRTYLCDSQLTLLTYHRQSIILYEEEAPNIHACPVRWFLYLALADNVFTGNKTLSDFEKRSLSSTAESYLFQIKPEKKELPIIRMMDQDGESVSMTRILSASALHHSLKQLGYRCGYKEIVTCYAFRRGFANGIEGKTSAPRLRQLMGHANDGILQSYFSSDIGIDVQNALRGLPQNTERIDSSRSLAFSRDTSAPVPSISTLGIRHCPLEEGRIAEIYNDLPHISRRDAINRLRNKDFLESRELFFHDETGKRHVYVSPDLPLRDTAFDLVLRFNWAQKQAIEVLWEQRKSGKTFLLEGLLTMARPEPFRPTYPGLREPILDGICTACNVELPPSKSKAAINIHILRCHTNNKRKPGLTYCFDCAEFLPTRLYEHHDKVAHLANPDPLCGILQWRKLLVRPGRCPFCMGNQKPLQRHFHSNSFNKHIEGHLKDIRTQDIKCPHTSCGGAQMDRISFMHHLNKVHGILVSQRHFQPSHLEIL